jgi:hypothetical protein
LKYGKPVYEREASAKYEVEKHNTTSIVPVAAYTKPTTSAYKPSAAPVYNKNTTVPAVPTYSKETPKKPAYTAPKNTTVAAAYTRSTPSASKVYSKPTEVPKVYSPTSVAPAYTKPTTSKKSYETSAPKIEEAKKIAAQTTVPVKAPTVAAPSPVANSDNIPSAVSGFVPSSLATGSFGAAAFGNGTFTFEKRYATAAPVPEAPYESPAPKPAPAPEYDPEYPTEPTDYEKEGYTTYEGTGPEDESPDFVARPFDSAGSE